MNRDKDKGASELGGHLLALVDRFDKGLLSKTRLRALCVAKARIYADEGQRRIYQTFRTWIWQRLNGDDLPMPYVTEGPEERRGFELLAKAVAGRGMPEAAELEAQAGLDSAAFEDLLLVAKDLEVIVRKDRRAEWVRL